MKIWLHYDYSNIFVALNGVEIHRFSTSANTVEITGFLKTILEKLGFHVEVYYEN